MSDQNKKLNKGELIDIKSLIGDADGGDYSLDDIMAEFGHSSWGKGITGAGWRSGGSSGSSSSSGSFKSSGSSKSSGSCCTKPCGRGWGSNLSINIS